MEYYDRIFYWYFPLYRTPWYYTPIFTCSHFSAGRFAIFSEPPKLRPGNVKRGESGHQTGLETSPKWGDGDSWIAQSYYTQLFRGRNQNLDQLGTVEYSFGQGTRQHSTLASVFSESQRINMNQLQLQVLWFWKPPQPRHVVQLIYLNQFRHLEG